MNLEIQCDMGGCHSHRIYIAKTTALAQREAEKDGWQIGFLVKCPTCMKKLDNYVQITRTKTKSHTYSYR